MRHCLLRNEQQFNGGFTDLFVVGMTHRAGATDFIETTNDLDQVITLTDLALGDIVWPDSCLLVKTAVAGLTAANASLGVTGAVTQFIANSSLLSGGNKYFVPAGTLAPYATIASSKSLILNIDPAANTEHVSSVTAGELWIYAKISRFADMVTLRQA